MATINASFGSAIQGSLINTATDTYQLTAAAGGLVTLDFIHPNGPGTSGLPIALTLMDVLGNVVTTLSVKGNTSLSTTVPAAGIYYLKVADNYSGGQYASGFYTITPKISSIAGVTYDGGANNAINTALSGTMGNDIIGSIYSDDVDVFKVHADSGGVLTLAVQHPSGAGSNGKNIVVDIIDAANNVLIHESLNGNATLTTTIANSGDYYMKVSDGTGTTVPSQTYTLTPTLSTSTGTTYDGVTNTTTTNAIVTTLGAPIVGTLNANDTDMFKVHANSGGVLSVTLAHPQGAGNDGRQIAIAILDAAGNVYAKLGMNGSDNFITTVPSAGDYYLKVSNDNTAYDIPGTYTVTPTLLNQPGVVYDNASNISAATALSAPLGTTIIGALNGIDTSYFKFTAANSGTLSLNFSHPNGAASNGHYITVAIIDSSGKTIYTKSEASSDLQNVTLTSSGDYYIKISSSYSYVYSDPYKVFAGLNGSDGSSVTGTVANDKFVSSSGSDLINGGRSVSMDLKHLVESARV